MVQRLQTIAAPPARVVLFGSSGFIASALARALAREKIEHRAISSREIDLLRPASVKQIQAELRPDDALVVTSALTPDKGRDVSTLMKNLQMAQHLAEALQGSACAHLIYISSDAVYGSRETLIRESSALEPRDLYGLMHVAREQIIAATAERTSIPVCIVRPCAIYGAGDTHNSYGPNRFLRAAMRERKITLFGAGDETRDHVYIEDVAHLLILCLKHRCAGTINAASGAAVPFRAVASIITDLVGDDVEVEHVPASGAVTHRHFDVTERIRVFPDFTPTPLAEGIAESLRRLTEPQRD